MDDARFPGTINQIDYFNTSFLANRCSDFSASASTRMLREVLILPVKAYAFDI